MATDDVAGLLLTGGASRRMGTAKAALPVPGGTTMAERLAGLLRGAATGPVLEVGPGHTRLPAVSDRREGPLVALAAGAAALVAAGHAGPALVLACDLPNVTAALLAFLAAAGGTAVPVVEGRPQPLCARYEASALRAAGALAAAGSRSMTALLDAVPVAWLDAGTWGAVADASTFADVDTPADLARRAAPR